MQLTGGCHCQNITFQLDWPEEVMVARRCSCTFCQKHSAAWSSHAESQLVISIANDADVSRYEMGTKTAQFLVCSACGVVTIAISEIEANLYAVFNVATLTATPELQVSETKTNFDSESQKGRLLRRQQNWICEVRFG